MLGLKKGNLSKNTNAFFKKFKNLQTSKNSALENLEDEAGQVFDPRICQSAGFPEISRYQEKPRTPKGVQVRKLQLKRFPAIFCRSGSFCPTFVCTKVRISEKNIIKLFKWPEIFVLFTLLEIL